MITQTIQVKTNVCPQFWKDIKDLHKSTKRKELKSSLEEDDLLSYDDLTKLKSFPYIEAIINTIHNKVPSNLSDIADKYDRQPFLNSGWTIWKMRYAIDNRGKSHGTRTIFCVNSENMLMACIKLKKDCANENKFEAEFMSRIKEYLAI